MSDTLPVRYKSLDEYLTESFEREPGLRVLFNEARAETDFGFSLIEARHARGLSQRELAKAAGMKQPMLHRIEKGAQTPTLTTLYRLMHALHAECTIGPDGAGVTLLMGPMPPSVSD
jgi:ribosome-binding protein aMBF1 (putative translation factor)